MGPLPVGLPERRTGKPDTIPYPKEAVLPTLRPTRLRERFILLSSGRNCGSFVLLFACPERAGNEKRTEVPLLLAG